MKKVYFFLCVFLLSSSLLGHNARAASLDLNTKNNSVSPNGLITVSVLLNTTDPINTIEGSITIPPSVSFVDYSDGGSILSYWVDQPQFDETSRVLHFSGILPHGYVGSGGRVIAFALLAQKLGTFTLSFDPAQTHGFENSPMGREIPLTLHEARITVSSTTEQNEVASTSQDTTPPEEFVPQITQIVPGTNVVVFATQDTSSGMSGYQVGEEDSKTPTDIVWHNAKSPYELQDQTLEKYVFVKAIDKSGNERIETLPPTYTKVWYKIALQLILLIGVAGSILFLFFLRRAQLKK